MQSGLERIRADAERIRADAERATRFVEQIEALNSIKAGLEERINNVTREKNRFEEQNSLHNQQYQNLTTTLTEEEQELANVRQEIARLESQLEEEQGTIDAELQNGCNRLWAKVGAGLFGAVTLPTVYGPMKACEWIQGIDANFNAATANKDVLASRIRERREYESRLSGVIAAKHFWAPLQNPNLPLVVEK